MSRRLLQPVLLGSLALALAACGAAETPPAEPQRVPPSPVQLECTLGDQPEKRYARDCGSELANVAEQEDGLSVQIARLEKSAAADLATVRSALASLAQKRRQLCHDWNACALTRDDHMDRYDRVSERLDSLAQLLAAAEAAEGDPAEHVAALRRWVTGEQAAAAPATAAAPAVTATPPAEQPQTSGAPPGAAPPPPGMPTPEQIAAMHVDARRRMLATVRQQERTIEELQAFLPVVQKIRAASQTKSAKSVPPLCVDLHKTQAELTELVRGPNSSIGSYSRGLLSQIENFCKRYERWEHPDDRVQGRLQRYYSHLDRVDGWFVKITDCIRPGPYDRRCENAYGPHRPTDEAEMRKAKNIVRQVRRALEGVKEGKRPFPCYSPLWSRINDMTWTQNVAKAQVPRMVTGAEQICRTIGVDEQNLVRARENLDRQLDTVESGVASQVRSHQETITRYRPYLQ